jgi:hypothetical protein
MFERWFAVVALIFSTASAFGACCGSPPTTPSLAWPIPFLGEMDPSTHLQRSFDSGKQGVGVAPWSEYWYKFFFAGPPGTGLTGFVATGGDFQSTITVVDNNLRPLGTLNGTVPAALPGGSYYIHVTAPGHTFFHFGLVAPPNLTQFPNDAGHTESTALNLGPLGKILTHSSSFYTFFARMDPPQDSPSQGSMTPDFSRPNPNPPLQSDFYVFTLATPGPVKLNSSHGGFGEPDHNTPQYILKQPDGTKLSWPNNQTINLVSGTYLLQVVDQRTEVTQGGNVTFRNSQFEDFENYRFQLLFQP